MLLCVAKKLSIASEKSTDVFIWIKQNFAELCVGGDGKSFFVKL